MEGKLVSTTPPALSASDKSSFAYPTIKDRVPVIICKVIDLLYRHRNEKTEEQREDIKAIVEKMAKLRYEVQTNKPFSAIKDGRSDQDVWNKVLKEETERSGGVEPKWFDTTWLYAECYAYRRLQECMSEASVDVSLRNEDFFAKQKRESFLATVDAAAYLVHKLEEVLKATNSSNMVKNFLLFLKVSLWGNKCDLSISSGTHVSMEEVDPEDRVSALERKVLIDDSLKVWERLSRENNSDEVIVDLVLDNAGFEVVSDLVLADFLISSGIANKVRLRAKNQPWFVSDTTREDLHWVLDTMGNVRSVLEKSSSMGKSSLPESQHLTDALARAAQKWNELFQKGSFQLCVDDFWTYPHPYSEMRHESPGLYRSLSESRLVVFKGDLNYRKLVGDLAWPPDTQFQKALRGFHPAPLVTLRTVKADVITGLNLTKAKELHALDESWMINGEWAVIQYCGEVIPISS